MAEKMSTASNERLSVVEQRLSNIERILRYYSTSLRYPTTTTTSHPLPCADVPSSYSELTTEMFVVSEYHRRKHADASELSVAKAEAFLLDHNPMVKRGVLYWSNLEFGGSALPHNSGPIDIGQMTAFRFTHSGIWRELEPSERFSLEPCDHAKGHLHDVVVVPRLDGTMMVVDWDVARIKKQCRRTATLLIHLE
jgi:hypothetical protein